MNLVELFCHVDDFCHAFEAEWLRHQLASGQRRLCLSEIIVLLIWFHQSQYRLVQLAPKVSSPQRRHTTSNWAVLSSSSVPSLLSQY